MYWFEKSLFETTEIGQALAQAEEVLPLLAAHQPETLLGVIVIQSITGLIQESVKQESAEKIFQAVEAAWEFLAQGK
jgi:hypothetical protein